MHVIFMLLWMIFFHIIDDFVLQPVCLSSLKQRSYWQENAPDKLYKHDYICALIMHSISWTFMIMLPIAYFHGFNITPGIFGTFLFNVAVHAFVDNLKANRKEINLWQDQLIHIGQILLTWMLVFI